jgi:hypothetical protein
MPAKKESAHDCKKDCELLHKEIASLKKEIAALKSALLKAPKGAGGSDPRVDKLVKALQLQQIEDLPKEKRIKNVQLSESIIKSL